MSAFVELPEFITYARVEEAHRRASLNQDASFRGNDFERERSESFANTGMRAARARDPRMLKVLEIAASLLDKAQDDQLGRTMRSQSATHAETFGTTEAQLWRESYRLMDEGQPIENFKWIYGAAAWLCGYNF